LVFWVGFGVDSILMKFASEHNPSHEVKCFQRESCGIHIVHEEAGGGFARRQSRAPRTETGGFLRGTWRFLASDLRGIPTENSVWSLKSFSEANVTILHECAQEFWRGTP
jgi:hypothetical protein